MESESEKYDKMFSKPKKPKKEEPCRHVFQGKCQITGRVVRNSLLCHCSNK